MTLLAIDARAGCVLHQYKKYIHIYIEMFVSTFIPKHSTITIPMYIYRERTTEGRSEITRA